MQVVHHKRVASRDRIESNVECFEIFFSYYMLLFDKYSSSYPVFIFLVQRALHCRIKSCYIPMRYQSLKSNWSFVVFCMQNFDEFVIHRALRKGSPFLKESNTAHAEVFIFCVDEGVHGYPHLEQLRWEEEM